MRASTEPRLRLGRRDRQVLSSLFAIDTRALAILRIGLALILLYRSVFVDYSLAESSGVILLVVENLSALVIPFALLLLVGLKTRFATIASWLLLSIPIRANLLAPGGRVDLGDYLLALMLFWGMFLPLGARLSVDAKRSALVGNPSQVLSVASGGLLIQFFFIYFSAGVTKDLGEWLVDASALETILGLPNFASELGQNLTQFPAVLAFMSVGTVILEVVGSILLFSPGRSLPTRRVMLTGAFIAFHLGIALFMSLGIFPYVMIVAWLVFLPETVWDRLFATTTSDGASDSPAVDRSRVRNTVAGAALGYVFASNVVTWLYYPVQGGFAELWQTVGRYLIIYQQWAMFSIPSSLS